MLQAKSSGMSTRKRARSRYLDPLQKKWMQTYCTPEMAPTIRHSHKMLSTKRYDIEKIKGELVFVRPDSLRFSGHYTTPDGRYEAICRQSHCPSVSARINWGPPWFDLVVDGKLKIRTENKTFALNWLHLKLGNATPRDQRKALAA